MTGEVIDLADCRPPTAEERLEALAALVTSTLGQGEAAALETLRALAVALSDLQEPEVDR